MKAFGVSILIVKDGMFLGVARRNDPNDWALAGGKVDPDESEEEAAIRECFEETGIRIWNLREVYRGLVGPDQGVTFMCDWGGEPVSQPGEPACRWITREELLGGCFGVYNAELLWAVGL